MSADLGWAESFIARFALPLSQGGELHVGAPLGARGAQRLLDAAHAGLDGTEPGEALQAARARRLRPFPAAPPMVLLEDRSALFLLVALHDLLFAMRPEAEALGERIVPVWRGALGLIGRARDVLYGQRQRPLPTRTAPTSVSPAPELAESQALPRLLARHSLLAGLWTLRRNDVRITSRWGATERRGSLPEPGTGLWARLSKTEQSVTLARCFPELLADAHGAGPAQALLAATPLTALLGPLDGELENGPAEAARWLLPLLDWLRFPLVARAVTRRYLALDGATLGHALGHALHQALHQGLAGTMPRPRLHLLLRLLCHLHLCRLLGEQSPPVAAPELSAATLDFFALFPVLRVRWPELAAPPDLGADPHLVGRVDAYAAACHALVGPARLLDLAARCGQALDPTQADAAPTPAPATA